MDINILHFSDIHYKDGDSKLNNLLDKLLLFDFDKKIDLIVFSGDLLQKPTEKEFENALTNFIKPLIKKFDISIDNCLFTIGNHDVDLDKRTKMIFSGFKVEREDKKTLNDIVSGKPILEEFQGYKKFIDNLNQSSMIESNVIYSVHKTNIKQIKMGAISINSSLFMEGSKVDYGKLWLSTSLLDDLPKKINDCDIKILNMHHPLDWFENKNEIEKQILDKFNICFFGHEHQHDGIHKSDLYNRDVLSLFATSMYHQSNERNGLCHYTYNIDKNEIEFMKIEYNKHHNIFEKINSSKIENINLMKKAPKAIRNQHICSEIFPNLKEHINKYLAINLTSENVKKDIEDIYTHPKIVKEENENEKKKFSKNVEEEKVIELNDFLEYEKNIILHGKQECGRTTILNMINVTFLKNNNNFIPIYIPGNELYNIDSIEVFKAKISDYLNKFYEKSKLDINKMVTEKRFIFLIDDINNLSNSIVEEIITLDNRIIATFVTKKYELNEDKKLLFVKESDLDDNFEKYVIKPLRKKDNKRLTKNIVPEASFSRISNKVITAITTLNLPSNPFITTLLAWMYVEKIEVRENEPQIIDVFLDYLLEKADLSKSFDGKLDFNDKKDLLSEIAYLFFNHETLSVKEDKILRVIMDYAEKYYAFEIDSMKILKYFYKRRILIRNNNLVQFSYRVFYYYFISIYMIRDKEFCNKVMYNKLYVINMIDELRYYSALKRDNTLFIKTLYSFMEENKFVSKVKKLSNIKTFDNKQFITIDVSKSNVAKYTKQKIKDNIKKDLDIDNEEEKLTLEEENFKNNVDNFRTEQHESKVDKYNHEELSLTQEVKHFKEEFFILNLIYSEFIKNISSLETEEKEMYFLNAVENFINVFRYWEERLEDKKLAKKFVNTKVKELNKITNTNIEIDSEELEYLRKNISAEVVIMIANMVEMTLSSPKMSDFYENLMESNNPYEALFGFIFKTETDEYTDDIVKYIDTFIGLISSRAILMVIQIKLFRDINHKMIKSNIVKNIKDVIFKLEYKLNRHLLEKNNVSKKDVMNSIDDRLRMGKLLT